MAYEFDDIIKNLKKQDFDFVKANNVSKIKKMNRKPPAQRPFKVKNGWWVKLVAICERRRKERRNTLRGNIKTNNKEG